MNHGKVLTWWAGVPIFILFGLIAIAEAEIPLDPTHDVVVDVVVDVVEEMPNKDNSPRTSTIQPIKELRIVKPEKLKELTQSGIYSADNESLAILQNPTEAMADFPTNRRHEVDWIKALDDGLINPRANIDGSEEMQPMDMDVIMEQTAGMPYVKFPHLSHTKWLSCDNCHTQIFEPVKNGNPITMGKILKGEYCGRCHDRVAFSLFVCEKCHNTPQ